MLTFQYDFEAHAITLTFAGRMDTLAVAKLTEMIENEPLMREWKQDEKMIFDLGDVEYISSSFIRICVSYAKLAGPDRFSMINCMPFVKKTFKISGLDEMLNIS